MTVGFFINFFFEYEIYFLVTSKRVLSFCVLKTLFMKVSSGDRNHRTKEALGTMGASVFRFIFFSMTTSLCIFAIRMRLLHNLVNSCGGTLNK